MACNDDEHGDDEAGDDVELSQRRNCFQSFEANLSKQSSPPRPRWTTIDEQLLTKFSFFLIFFSEVLYSIGLFNLDTKPELLLDLLIGHLHALVLVGPTLFVHLI